MLHPIVLSEEAASLLPDRVRGTFVCAFELDQEEPRYEDDPYENARAQPCPLDLRAGAEVA